MTDSKSRTVDRAPVSAMSLDRGEATGNIQPGNEERNTAESLARRPSPLTEHEKVSSNTG
jgi:hypothetical protein